MNLAETPGDVLHEIIKLQLKKPKHWNWQLSTSKSSPHISLPIIQLYNYKGQLLVEAHDNGIQPRIWHSATTTNVFRKIPNIKQNETNNARKLQRCRSDKNFDGNNRGRSLRDEGFYRHCRIGDDVKRKLPEQDKLLYKLPEKCENPPFHHRRSNSDDLFRRKLKCNEESLKRAQIDGYTNFLQTAPTRINGEENNGILLPNKIADFNKKYKTRTSSAGTIIISEESFNNNNWRRRRQRNNIGPDGASAWASFEDCKASHPRPDELSSENRYGHLNINKRNRIHPKIVPNGVVASQSDTFLFRNMNRNTYIVEEPITPNSEKKFPIIEGMDKCCNRQSMENNGDRSSFRSRKWDRSRLSAIRTQKGSSGGDLEQLQRVQRPSSDHVKMGANVSRHSSKGLSGRRSQSSGSICNGKGGRHSSTDGKMCGSLPSYLDERNTNNNHQDCEKPPLEEMQRIPPLGDGAPLHWKFSDNQTVLCDQGYGSERSPEEEYPPPLPDHDSHHHLEPHACYPFITPESTFLVKLVKSSRGLGLSVTGGIDSGGSWPGLIRIKRLFPHQPASVCGLLNVGDLIVEANGITLTGLTNYEALEVLRTASNQVELKVCRPPPDVLSCVSPISEVPPPPPRREPPSSLNLPLYSTPEDDYYHGEFEVILTKIQGSLGFTLRKEDDSALGHYVRALVREPALTDGRIKAGDKIIAVNDVEISEMTHEQAVQYLRQCGNVVKLRLYRDSAQTPVAALSPNETTPRASFSKKANLRQEAMDMLNDIAVRKLIPGNEDQSRRSLSPTASPRRLRRQPYSSDASSQITESSTANYLINDEQFHEGLLEKLPLNATDEIDAFNSLFTTDSDDGVDRPSRPISLDLYNPNQTPVAARKPRFNFSLAHNAYELNNLDPEVLDAPNLTYNLGNDDAKSTEVECGDSFPKEPASMPHIPIDNNSNGFHYKNPVYQSAHPQCGGTEEKKKKEKDKLEDGEIMTINENYEILAIELNRGWNSRLGFSLQGAAGVTYVSAVYPDSVASKDGRLKAGDRVIKVNDESVEHMTTVEIIELLRIVRGPVCIVVSRLKEDCQKSNAEN